MSISAAMPDKRVQSVEVTDDSILVVLRDGRAIRTPLHWYPRLMRATADQRQHWEISAAGHGVHWPLIDEDLSVDGMLRGERAPQDQ